MAGKHGGARAGSGRKVGSGDKPHIRDYWTPEQIVEFYSDLFERAKKSDRIAVWCGDQLSGKAVQALTGPDGGPIEIKGVNISVRRK